MSSDGTGAFVALNRFGLGGRPGDIVRIAGDPRGFVLSQVTPRVLDLGVQLPGSAEALVALRRVAMAKNRMDAMLPPPTQAAAMEPAPPPMKPAKDMLGPPVPPPPENALFQAEAEARFKRLATADGGLAERLVAFWANHFCISSAKGAGVRIMAGPFEREAIRPHVFGRFADMLLAVEKHPAMLYYLDAQDSIGPTSKAGQNGRKGLNENLAREILELHTLGVDGGYTQADVTSLARIITGWTVTFPDEDTVNGGRFAFNPNRHEPGDHMVLGRTYLEEFSERQGEAVLADLAAHPATARHVARKLVRHFVADDPPPALVQRLAQVFSETNGNLAAVTRALVSAPEAWAAPPAKLRSPLGYLTAMMRATGFSPDTPALLNQLRQLGMPLWLPPGPNGFGDVFGEWGTPEGIDARLDIAAQWGRQASVDPVSVMTEVLGPVVSPQTRQAVTRAESRAQGLAILFMSPEFQRS
jgi:uncharacterized protein (DUF1800 family)